MYECVPANIHALGVRVESPSASADFCLLQNGRMANKRTRSASATLLIHGRSVYIYIYIFEIRLNTPPLSILRPQPKKILASNIY